LSDTRESAAASDVRGVVFDLDATLVNLGGFVKWREAHMEAIEAYAACGCPDELVSRCSGGGLFRMMNEIREELSGRLPPSDVERVQGAVYDAVERHEMEGMEKCHILPGCIEALEWLRERGIRTGLATSNSQRVAERVLELNGLSSYFASVVGRRPDLPMKPHPAPILKCLEEMRVDPGEGVMVGDSPRDIEAAKSAGVYAVAIPSPFSRLEAILEAGADRVIGSLEELPPLIEGLRLR
jgi:phosphoglycolate phosphatase